MFIVARPQIAEEAVSPTRSKFIIEPLEPGFGYTVGNSLRPTLLSSIPGAAISSVRIEGVLHEFSSIKGVTEDVTDIILNLKDLVVRSELDEPVTVLGWMPAGLKVVVLAPVTMPAAAAMPPPFEWPMISRFSVPTTSDRVSASCLAWL